MSLLEWVRQACGCAISRGTPEVGKRVAKQLACAVLAAVVWPTTTFAQSTSTAERFFNSAADAQNACTSEPVEYYCGNDGQLYQSACNTIAGPHGAGLSNVTRVEMAKPGATGACYYTSGSSLKYTYFVWRDTPCPSGTTFTGPGANDCVNSAFTQTAQSAQKGCGGGGGNGDDNSCKRNAAASKDAKESVGNPINTLNGNKTQREVDIEAGNGVPGFVRTYNSLQLRDLATIGVGWTHNWARRLERTGNTISVIRGDGSSQNFTFSGTGYGQWSGDPDTKFMLVSSPGGYTLTLQNGSTEQYDGMGALLSVKEPSGLTTLIDQSQGVITSVTGPYGHRLTFGWSAGRLVSVQDSNGKTVTFNVDGSNNLTSVGYPDGGGRTYVYEANHLPHGLTGIIDLSGIRLSTYTYSTSTLLATSTQRAGGVGLVAMTFDGFLAHIQDAFGRVVTKLRSTIFGMNKTTATTNSADSKTASNAYDAQGNVSSTTNEEGQTTTSVYDSANRLVSTTQAYGTPIARTTEITYADPFVAIPSTISEPSVRAGSSKTTTYLYGDARFPLLPTSVAVSGYTPSGTVVSRTTGVSYNALGQVAQVDGPRSDVNDTTGIEYWQCNTGGACGQLKRVTNALGHASTFDSYDGAGRPTQVTSPSGVVTTYGYNARGKVTSITQTAGSLSRSTTFGYDGSSRLVSAALPTGRVLTYTYDGADQLLSVVDQFGNKVVYTYNARGDRTGQTVQDSAGNIAAQATIAYDARSNLQSITTAGATVQVSSDALGNPLAVQDGNGNITTNSFDGLNRLWKTVNALGGQTTTAFTPAGDPAQLTTPNGAVFGFDVDDLQNTLQERSPDRGVINLTYDAAGNLVSRTDARGVTVSMLYDALHRPTQVTYPSGTENTTYFYDSCGVGKLCTVADGSGVHTFEYDPVGRRTQEVWTASAGLGGHVFTTSYTWTLFDKLQSVTSPSGRTVNFLYDALGRVSSVSSGGQPLVSGRAYRADGALIGQTFGNSIEETRSYDTAGRLAMWSIGGIETRTYTRDWNGNVTAIATGGASKAYGYDAIDRLTSEPGSTFSWDPNGNRLGDSTGGYTYAAGSNRLATGPVGSISVDASGNTTAIGSRMFGYSEGGRLVQASNSGAVIGSYVYRAGGLRAAKTTSSGTTLFHWDDHGNLLEETTTGGVPIRSYAWVEGTPVAQWTGTGPVSAVYIHTDQLATPRIATSAGGTVVWRWDGAAFGASSPTGSAMVNLRFPGQYFDVESGLHQNWTRDYDPTTGRFLQSDTVGLAGGINTFAYVDGGPLSDVDPTGEFGLIGAVVGGLGDLGYQLYKNGGNAKCVNWWEVGSWMLTGSGAGIVGRAGLAGVGRFFFDPRKWNAISTAYWVARGGAGTSSLDHWLITKSFAKNNGIPSGVTNAGFNLVEMPQVMNSFLGGFLAPGVERTASVEAAIALSRVGATGLVLGTAGLAGATGFISGTLAQQDTECGCK